MNNWKIRQVDINNAFLNGDLIKDVFMMQPKGFINVYKPGHICKLNQALYGLKQAPRAWFDKLKETLIKWGFQNSRADTSLFLKKEKGSMIMVLIYVDDILITGPNSKALEDFISHFSLVFALKDLGICLISWGLKSLTTMEVFSCLKGNILETCWQNQSF